MGALRYERAPDEAFVAALQGPLAFLLDPQLRAGKYALDAQFREGNRLMLYTGSTCLLSLQYLEDGRLAFDAADTYRKAHAKCAGPLLLCHKEADEAQRGRVQAFDAGSQGLREAIAGYLDGVAPEVHTSWLRKESAVQMNARLVHSAGTWWHLDREGVLGGGVPTNVNEIVKEAWARLLATPAFAKRRPQRPETLQKEKGQDELDQLGIDREGRLVLAELKFGEQGSNATFIYAAPIQLLRYAWAWDAAMRDATVRDGLQRLLAAKRSLFPSFYAGAPASFGEGLRAVIGFGDEGLRKDRELQDKFWSAVEVAQQFLPASVRGQRIEVWSIGEDGEASKAERIVT